MHDHNYCTHLISAFADIFPQIKIQGGGAEPFYQAPKGSSPGIITFRENFPRSLLHEVSHYCLAGDRRRKIDDFGYWYSPARHNQEEQERFEQVEARPQGLEKLMCEIVGLDFSPSLDNFLVSHPSQGFIQALEAAYREMKLNPPPTAYRALSGLARHNRLWALT